MTDDTEIDVEELRSELDQIKDAMGIQERYPGRIQFWLVYGALVPLASAISQYVVLADLPSYYHALAWFGLMSLGGVYAWFGAGDTEAPTDDGGKPSVPFLFGAVFSYYLVITATLSQFPSVTQPLDSAVIFAMIVGLVGVSYLLLGNALRAYYIRRRDRMTLYVGGVWMLGLAVAIPVFEPLHTWGYAAFGVLFGLHSVGSYVFLSRGDER